MGSSSRRTDGSINKALARESLCFSPPESKRAGLLSYPSNPTLFKIFLITYLAFLFLTLET